MKSPQNSTRERFPYFSRLRKPVDFISVKRFGRRARGRYIRLSVHPSGCKSSKFKDELVDLEGSSGPRVGIVVSKRRVSKAWARNLWRRRLRDIFRRDVINCYKKKKWPIGDYVALVQGAERCPPYAELRREVMSLLDQLSD